MNKRKKHEDRRDEILDTAMRVLAFEGNASATMRGIAERVGISLAAVQYYFPTRRELLRNTIERCIGTDLRQMHDVSEDLDTNPQESLHKVVQIHFSSSRDPLISKFFTALWALASHEDELQEMMNEFYESECKKYAALIKRANSKLTQKVCDARAVLLMAQLEGLVLLVAPGRVNSALMKRIEKELNALVDRAIIDT